jgi:hypothetical protein
MYCLENNTNKREKKTHTTQEIKRKEKNKRRMLMNEQICHTLDAVLQEDLTAAYHALVLISLTLFILLNEPWKTASHVKSHSSWIVYWSLGLLIVFFLTESWFWTLCIKRTDLLHAFLQVHHSLSVCLLIVMILDEFITTASLVPVVMHCIQYLVHDTWQPIRYFYFLSYAVCLVWAHHQDWQFWSRRTTFLCLLFGHLLNLFQYEVVRLMN